MYSPDLKHFKRRMMNRKSLLILKTSLFDWMNSDVSCPSLARFSRSHGLLRTRPFEGEKEVRKRE